MAFVYCRPAVKSSHRGFQEFGYEKKESTRKYVFWNIASTFLYMLVIFLLVELWVLVAEYIAFGEKVKK